MPRDRTNLERFHIRVPNGIRNGVHNSADSKGYNFKLPRRLIDTPNGTDGGGDSYLRS